MRRFTLWILLICLIVTAFADESEARRRRRTRKRAKIINEKKLYERIGGNKVVSNIVDEWMRINLGDNRISFYFKNLTAEPEKLARFRRQLANQICVLGDGPCKAENGGALHKTHTDLLANEDHFLIFADNLFRSMQKYNIAEREKNELLARLGEYRGESLPEQSLTSKESSEKPQISEPAIDPAAPQLKPEAPSGT